MEEFLAQTHWQRDNPELADENYLTDNRICRWVYGRFVYFSCLLWESEVFYERGREKGWIADESVRELLFGVIVGKENVCLKS